jgi:hypothetical protein
MHHYLPWPSIATPANNDYIGIVKRFVRNIFFAVLLFSYYGFGSSPEDRYSPDFLCDCSGACHFATMPKKIQHLGSRLHLTQGKNGSFLVKTDVPTQADLLAPDSHRYQLQGSVVFPGVAFQASAVLYLPSLPREPTNT